MASRADLQQRLAAEFSRQSWPLEHEVWTCLLDPLVEDRAVNAQAMAARVPANYLERHGINRQDLGAAVERAIGGERLSAPVAQAFNLQIQDNRYSIQIGDGATLSGSSLNTAGSQVVIKADSDKSDLLQTILALIDQGLNGAWNAEAAADLGAVIDEREDVSIDDIREIAQAAAAPHADQPSRLRALLEQVAVGASSGALGIGIAAGIGALL